VGRRLVGAGRLKTGRQLACVELWGILTLENGRNDRQCLVLEAAIPRRVDEATHLKWQRGVHQFHELRTRPLAGLIQLGQGDRCRLATGCLAGCATRQFHRVEIGLQQGSAPPISSEGTGGSPQPQNQAQNRRLAAAAVELEPPAPGRG